MANEEQLAILRQGRSAWNRWRGKNRDARTVDLSGADLRGADLCRAYLRRADFCGTRLDGANLYEADLSRAQLRGAKLGGADLRRADLREANLYGTDLSRADLSRAALQRAVLIKTNLSGSNLTGCLVYGAAVWCVILDNAEQNSLVITEHDNKRDRAEITVDNLEIAQFVHLLLHNEKIRDVIDTIGKKGVLLLGRFTEGRLAVLERLRDEMRRRGFVPLVFNFDQPATKDFTETVRLLAGLSRFVVADITNPRSVPLELQATVPECMIPFVPILEKGEEPFAMFKDLWVKHRTWVLDPIRYPSVERLVEVLDAEIVKPAEARFAELLARKAEDLRIRDI
jgi:hypothetical protein